MVSWNSNLHGAFYKWGVLTGDTDLDSVSPRPSISFPMMKALGFNLVSIYFRWQIYLNNPSQYLGYLEMIASAADASGLNVVYSLETDDLPNCLVSSYSGNPAQWGNALLTNGATQCSQAIWTMNENLWKAIIGQLDSHSSTLGYGIYQEPGIAYCNSTALATYNTHFAQYIRGLSSKFIVWMGPYNRVGGGWCGTVSGTVASAPPSSVGNLVFSGHDYDRGGQIASYASVASQTGSILWIGEWAVSNVAVTLTETQVDAILASYVSLFKKYNSASNYWAWQVANPVASSKFQNLLDASANEWWLTTDLAKAYGAQGLKTGVLTLSATVS